MKHKICLDAIGVEILDCTIFGGALATPARGAFVDFDVGHVEGRACALKLADDPSWLATSETP